MTPVQSVERWIAALARKPQNDETRKRFRALFTILDIVEDRAGNVHTTAAAQAKIAECLDSMMQTPEVRAVRQEVREKLKALQKVKA